MTDDELDRVVSRHGRRWLHLTSDDNPDVAQRDAYRELVSRLASGDPPAPPSYPSTAQQLGNALAAAGRFVASGFATVDRSEFDRRRSICMGCPSMDRDQDRCVLCGCALAVKPWSKAERCPAGKWDAPQVDPPS